MFWSKPKVSAHDKAILDLKLQRDKIKQYQKRISAVVQREHQLARQCLQQGDKPKATILLRRKKYQQQLLAKTDQQLATLEELTSSIEFSQIQKDVLFGLEQGSRVLKELNAQMSIDRVERIMDDSAEGIAYQQEISDMLADRITIEEEGEVQDELEKIEREERAKLTGSNTLGLSAELPDAPKMPVAPANATEEGKKNETETHSEMNEQPLPA